MMIWLNAAEEKKTHKPTHGYDQPASHFEPIAFCGQGPSCSSGMQLFRAIRNIWHGLNAGPSERQSPPIGVAVGRAVGGTYTPKAPSARRPRATSPRMTPTINAVDTTEGTAGAGGSCPGGRGGPHSPSPPPNACRFFGPVTVEIFEHRKFTGSPPPPPSGVSTYFSKH